MEYTREQKEKILTEVKEKIKDCSNNKMPYICKKIENKEGMEYVIKKVIQVLKSNNDFSIENALFHIELELKDIDLYD